MLTQCADKRMAIAFLGLANRRLTRHGSESPLHCGSHILCTSTNCVRCSQESPWPSYSPPHLSSPSKAERMGWRNKCANIRMAQGQPRKKCIFFHCAPSLLPAAIASPRRFGCRDSLIILCPPFFFKYLPIIGYVSIISHYICMRASALRSL